jgi:hypothetical protein
VNLIDGSEAVAENEQSTSEKAEDEENDYGGNIHGQPFSSNRTNLFPISEKS